MPHHRFTVYAMGIGLGYVLRMFKDIKLTQSQLKIGWYLSIASLLLAFFGPAPMGDIDYKYDAAQASQYAAFAPIVWCIFFGWIIFVSQLGYKSELIVDETLITCWWFVCLFADTFIDLIEWKGFLFCTKISYSLYLTQFPVFFYNVGRVRTPITYGLFGVVVGMFLCCLNNYFEKNLKLHKRKLYNKSSKKLFKENSKYNLLSKPFPR